MTKLNVKRRTKIIKCTRSEPKTKNKQRERESEMTEGEKKNGSQ